MFLHLFTWRTNVCLFETTIISVINSNQRRFWCALQYFPRTCNFFSFVGFPWASKGVCVQSCKNISGNNVVTFCGGLWNPVPYLSSVFHRTKNLLRIHISLRFNETVKCCSSSKVFGRIHMDKVRLLQSSMQFANHAFFTQYYTVQATIIQTFPRNFNFKLYMSRRES